MSENPRSRSAKLRAAHRVDASEVEGGWASMAPDDEELDA
jgi:hypothetical protein